MKVFITRHGQTEWNSLGRLQGRKDIELNEVGKEQALITGEKIKDEKLEIINTSPLKRARETAETLKKENFTVDIVTDGEKGENEALTNIYDLILLDIMLPNKDGFQILDNLRKEKIDTPIIILTAKSEMSDKLNGLENGADDYITKPFHMRELVARVKVILKRKTNVEDMSILEYHDLKLDVRTGKMTSYDNEIPINGKELDLLEILLVNKNQIVNRETLANKIWGYNSDTEYNNVEVYISFLRKKLKLIKSNVKIKAVRGIGYKLEVEDD